MRTIVLLLLILLILSATAFAQDQYPKFFRAGQKIETTPDKNVYIITETQFDNSLTINELYKNGEKRIALLQTKIAMQDSIINLLRQKEANFDSTLAHTRTKLDQCTDEAQVCQKDLATQNSRKKMFMGLAGLEAIIILILAL